MEAGRSSTAARGLVVGVGCGLVEGEGGQLMWMDCCNQDIATHLWVVLCIYTPLKPNPNPQNPTPKPQNPRPKTPPEIGTELRHCSRYACTSCVLSATCARRSSVSAAPPRRTISRRNAAAVRWRGGERRISAPVRFGGGGGFGWGGEMRGRDVGSGGFFCFSAICIAQ